SKPSRLEELIAENRATETTAELLSLIRTHHLSKYNDAPDYTERLSARPVVLVVDQTFGDWSVFHGGATPATFTRMLDAAIDENPGAEVIVRVHPDTLSRGRRGHLLEEAQRRGVRVFAKHASFGSLARQAARIYTVTSLAGFEALILGVKVTCFGRAFYAGWGLTDDRVAFERRTARPSLDALASAAYERYPRYIDPVHGRECDALTLAQRLAASRARDAALAGDAVVMGVSRWKRGFVRPFIAAPRAQITYRTPSPPPPGARAFVWASRETARLDNVTWIEDGFLRSAGLGSNFLPALSLVLDKDGIYFDPSRESGIEKILKDPAFPSQAMRADAQKLRARLVAGGLSKYNVRTETATPARNGKRVILVPGQVEDDQSILRGSPVIKRNLDLLAAVRAASPDATILYKPHPEIEAGNRRGAVRDADALRHADKILTGIALAQALDAADEIHTMTSLTGFEALLRGKSVTLYGLPFYAGLGLTIDRVPWPRPRRAVDLDALIAAVYLAYPRYNDPATNLPISAFDALDILERQRQSAPPAREKLARALRWIRLTAGNI
ncbi:MAG: capsular polysaccharide biosynthesis protein, partial [Stellaceae bacterium]